MNKIKLNAFRKTLESRQQELETGNRRREDLTIQTSSDELDRIQFAGDRDRAMDTLERNSNRLREVQIALRRIGAGTYGVCVECEEEINSKRLAAVPWASTCVACQEAVDRGQQNLRSEFHTSLLMTA
jgi:DnaK suppressor protein